MLPGEGGMSAAEKKKHNRKEQADIRGAAQAQPHVTLKENKTNENLFYAPLPFGFVTPLICDQICYCE